MVSPVPGRTPTSVAQAHAHGLAGQSALLQPAQSCATSCTMFAFAYAIGGSDATADNWVGFLVVCLLLAGVMAALAAFVLASAAIVRRERWALLWLPVSVFPAVFAFMVLGEAFWWE